MSFSYVSILSQPDCIEILITFEFPAGGHEAYVTACCYAGHSTSRATPRYQQYPNVRVSTTVHRSAIACVIPSFASRRAHVLCFAWCMNSTSFDVHIGVLIGCAGVVATWVDIHGAWRGRALSLKSGRKLRLMFRSTIRLGFLVDSWFS
jgi:hypothetical protein